MAKGDWFKMYRKIIYSEVFSEKDPWILKLWTYCLAKANWKEQTFSGEQIMPGSFALTIRHTCDFLRVSHGALDRGLKKLEAMGQITKKAGRKFTLVTICNWETYQNEEEDERGAIWGASEHTKRGARRGAARGASEHTKEEGKERQEGKEVKGGPEIVPVRPEDLPIPPELESPHFRTAWGHWCTYRRDRKASLREITMLAQLESLKPLGPEGAIDCLRTSIRNGWTGIFPEGKNHAPKRKHNTGSPDGTPQRGNV